MVYVGTTDDGMGVALSIYSGMFAYSGWNTVTLVTEEIKKPARKIPLSIVMSMITVEVVYLCVNVSYYLVLDNLQVCFYQCRQTPNFILSSTVFSINREIKCYAYVCIRQIINL